MRCGQIGYKTDDGIADGGRMGSPGFSCLYGRWRMSLGPQKKKHCSSRLKLSIWQMGKLAQRVGRVSSGSHGQFIPGALLLGLRLCSLASNQILVLLEFCFSLSQISERDRPSLVSEWKGIFHLGSSGSNIYQQLTWFLHSATIVGEETEIWEG